MPAGDCRWRRRRSRVKARMARRATTTIPPTIPPTTVPVCEVDDGDVSEVAVPLADCAAEDGEDDEDGDKDIEGVGVAAGSGSAEYGPASVSSVESFAALKSLTGHPSCAQGSEVQQPMKVGRVNWHVHHLDPSGHWLPVIFE